MENQKQNPRPKRLGFWKLNIMEYLQEKIWARKVKAWDKIIEEKDKLKKQNRNEKISK